MKALVQPLILLFFLTIFVAHAQAGSLQGPAISGAPESCKKDLELLKLSVRRGKTPPDLSRSSPSLWHDPHVGRMAILADIFHGPDIDEFYKAKKKNKHSHVDTGYDPKKFFAEKVREIFVDLPLEPTWLGEHPALVVPSEETLLDKENEIRVLEGYLGEKLSILVGLSLPSTHPQHPKIFGGALTLLED